MSTLSHLLDRSHSAEPVESRFASAVKRLGAGFMDAQQARADRVVKPYLARLADANLAELGFTNAEIQEIKKERHLPVVRWV
ncbi:MAG: hypothetical protein KDJ47_11470 [Hyphomicrobiaceae bacterium]|nr:hypothetical protein [Hyphomicrobiaceae bacterium]